MTYREFLEKQENGRFNIVDWLDRLQRAESARTSFDADYDRACGILSNSVETGGKNDLTQYTDQMFHTNWLLKLCIWLESYIMSPDIYIDLKSASGVDDLFADRLILEQEENHLFSEFKIPKRFKQVIRDRVRYGFGASLSGWNEMAIDQYWRKGKPNFIPFDCRRVWVDESSVEDNFSDRRWAFAKLTYDIEDAKRLFPDYADKIAESVANTAHGDSYDKKDLFDVFLCQYHIKQIARMCDVRITEVMDGIERKEIKQFLASEVEDWLANAESMPDNVEILDMADVENIGYDAEVHNVFQFMFSKDLSTQLTDITWLGKNIDNFNFWTYHRIEGDIYPRGTAFMLQDEQTIKTIILTKAAIQAVKDGRSIPFIEEGAIKNAKDFVENHNSLDYTAIVDSAWREEHPGQKAFEMVEQRFDPTVVLALNNLLKDEMQQFSGGTDSMMGQAQYAGMSAAQTGMLQASGATYTKSDELTFRDYVETVSDCYLCHIGEYKTYEHYLEGLANDGQPETLIINQGDMADWDYERYYTVPEIIQSNEMQKQLKAQQAMQLSGMGKMGTVRMLEELGYNNASQIAKEAQDEQGIYQMIAKLQANPQLWEQIMALPDKPQTASNATK